MPDRDRAYQKYKAERDNPSRSESFSDRYLRERLEREQQERCDRSIRTKSRSEQIWDNDDFKDM